MFNPRRRSVAVVVGEVTIGGDAPIVVQSMTNTDTADSAATVAQVRKLADAGSELVRITVNTAAAAAAVSEIRKRLDDAGCTVPLIGDFHYQGHRLLLDYPYCAAALAKYRINPGNVGFGVKRDEQFATLIKIAIDNGKAVRIGVNWGSLDQSLLAHKMDENARRQQPLEANQVIHQALVASALESAEKAESLGLGRDRLVLSCKVSGVQDLIAVYSQLAAAGEYALHLGLTEAGMGSKGIVASTAAIGILLQQGIGDTIRVSLTPAVNGDRCQEVIVSQQILQTMGLRAFTPQVIACPGCGRTTSQFFQQLAERVETHLRTQMPLWKKRYRGVEALSVAVMGCVVNGPGESRHANIGISLPGSGESPVAPVFVDGRKTVTLRGAHIAEQFQQLVDEYIAVHYAPRTTYMGDMGDEDTAARS